MQLQKCRSLAWIGVVVVLLLGACRPRDGGRTAGIAPGDDVSPAPGSVTLALEKQEYIWDIEHTAFELEQKFGKALGQAIQQRSTAAIQAFCREGFVARLPSEAEPVQYDLGYLREDRVAVGESASVSGGAADFARYLVARFEDFDAIEKVSCRVLDLHADNKDPASGHWDWTLYLNAVGKDRQQGFIESTSEHRLRCYFLDDQAIEKGEILDGWTVRYETLRRAARPLFAEVTQQIGLDQVDVPDNWNVARDKVRQYHTQMAATDFDRDGFDDLALASASGRWQLLRNVAGQKFEEVNDQVGLPAWAAEEPRSRSVDDQVYLAAWADLDNDGFPDLILGDRLYRNREGRRFEDVTDRSGLVFGYNPRGCLVADYDVDGRLDLYVLYQLPATMDRERTPGWVGDDETGLENHLWRNTGDMSFVNTTEDAHAGGGKRQSFAAAWLHANDDPYPDLYIANDFGTNTLLVNEGNGKFRDGSQASGVADYATSMGVATGDLTGDGRPEIYVANMFSKMGRRIIAHVDAEDYPPGIFQQIQGSCAGNRLYVAPAGDGSYEEISEDAGVNAVGWAYAPALADFDADGQLDIYSTTGFLSYQRGKPDG